jgi:hypothetical protein
MKTLLDAANPLNLHSLYNDELVLGEDDPAHMVPTFDTKPHICRSDRKCWCNPHYDEHNDVMIHNSADGREDYEEGWRLPH